MGLRIQSNIEAMNAYRNLSNTSNALGKSLEKLSSGFRINRAADDAAGLSISEGLKSETNGFKVAIRNAQDGISLIQTAEGALNETTNLLQRVRDLTVQASNTGANDTASRSAISREVTQALAEVDRISQATVFGSTSLLNGSLSAGVTFHVGYNGSAFNQITVAVTNQNANSLGLTVATLTAAISGTTASAWLATIDIALASVTATRSNLGSFQNRLESTINNLGTSVENLSASMSRIKDVDMADEMTQFSKEQILQQAGTAMLAQANSLPSSVLTLLKG